MRKIRSRSLSLSFSLSLAHTHTHTQVKAMRDARLARFLSFIAHSLRAFHWQRCLGRRYCRLEAGSSERAIEPRAPLQFADDAPAHSLACAQSRQWPAEANSAAPPLGCARRPAQGEASFALSASLAARLVGGQCAHSASGAVGAARLPEQPFSGNPARDGSPSGPSWRSGERLLLR